MATTDELIERLAADVTPLPRGAAVRRLAAGIALGAAVSSALVLAWLGPPLHALERTGTAAFTMKLLFCIALFTVSAALLLAAARPGRDIGKRWLWLAVPTAVVAASAAMELSLAGRPVDEIWFGSTWQTCLLEILVLSVPIFTGVLWAFQRLAPTKLRLAGLLAGLTAGSAGATLYALYCPETTATFLVSWYSLGILAAGTVGALIGPRWLRW